MRQLNSRFTSPGIVLVHNAHAHAIGLSQGSTPWPTVPGEYVWEYCTKAMEWVLCPWVGGNSQHRFRINDLGWGISWMVTTLGYHRNIFCCKKNSTLSPKLIPPLKGTVNFYAFYYLPGKHGGWSLGLIQLHNKPSHFLGRGTSFYLLKNRIGIGTFKSTTSNISAPCTVLVC